MSPLPPGEGSNSSQKPPSRPDTPISAGAGKDTSPAPPLPSTALATHHADPVCMPESETPAWDRTVDAVCHKDQHSHLKRQSSLEAFTGALKAFRRNEHPPTSRHGSRSASGSSGFSEGSRMAGRKISYVDLPDNVRLLICRYLTPDDKRHGHRPVSLSLGLFLREVWDRDTFTSITRALVPLQPYLAVSRDLRADILVSFLTRKTFHVVLSPFINARLSPHATLWMFRYGVYMRRIVVEIDLSHLGGGPEGASLLPTTKAFERQIKMVSETQLHREKDRPIEELTLLCRRYFGVRQETADGMNAALEKLSLASPTAPSFTTPAPTQSAFDENTSRRYCADSQLHIADPFKSLSSRISSLRMCGFSDKYTTRFVADMFPDPRHRFSYRLAPSAGPWGRVPKQKTPIVIDDGTGQAVLDGEYTSSEPPRPVELFCARFKRPVMPPPPAVAPGTGGMSFPTYSHEQAMESYREMEKAKAKARSRKRIKARARKGQASKDVSDEATSAMTSASAAASEMASSERKRQFMKMLGQSLVNRDKRRFFSR